MVDEKKNFSIDSYQGLFYVPYWNIAKIITDGSNPLDYKFTADEVKPVWLSHIDEKYNKTRKYSLFGETFFVG